MAQEIVVVEGPNRFGKAYVRRRDIKYGWRKYHPTSIELVQSAGGTVGNVVGGAALGWVLTGGVGAVVGGLAGGRAGRTTFLVETVEGRQLVCQCPTKLYPGVYVAVSKMVDKAARSRASSGTPPQLQVNPLPALEGAQDGVPVATPPQERAGCGTWFLRVMVGLALFFVLLAIVAVLR